MQHWIRLYGLELLVVAAGLIVSAGAHLLFGKALGFTKDELTYVSVTNAGLLFILGHMYSRLKDRRDGKRKRAQELFLEWHSKDIRGSRIFVSRWKEVHDRQALPSLGSLEKEAATQYRQRHARSVVEAAAPTSEPASPMPPALDDPELKELHHFRIYQFFERWALLVKNSDIDHAVASEYMSSYKAWYLGGFIKPWHESELDGHIKQQFSEIVRMVEPAH